jgi:3-oxoadipate enol-lactonase
VEPEDADMIAQWERSMELEKARDWPALVELEVDMWLEGPGQTRGRTGPRLRELMTHWGLENYTDARKYGTPIPLDPPAAGRLGEVTVPTQVIWGDFDEAGVLAGSPAIANGIAGAERHVLSGVAHMVNLERPADFQKLVLDFIGRIAE